MKVHKLVSYTRIDGKTFQHIRCSGQQYNARFKRQSTEDLDKVTCLRCNGGTR